MTVDKEGGVVNEEVQGKPLPLGPGGGPVLGKLAGMIRLHLAPGIPILPHGDRRGLVHPAHAQVGHHVGLSTEQPVHAKAGPLFAVQFPPGRVGNHGVGHVALTLADSLFGQRDSVRERDENTPETHLPAGGCNLPGPLPLRVGLDRQRLLLDRPVRFIDKVQFESQVVLTRFQPAGLERQLDLPTQSKGADR